MGMSSLLKIPAFTTVAGGDAANASETTITEEEGRGVMKNVLADPKVRQYLYSTATAVLALLVGYDIVAPDQVPLWLGFAAAVFAISATSTAAVVVSQQRRDGTLD